MKNALILHGTNSNSKANWFPWLKKKLEEKGYEVWLPDLPQAEKPSIPRYNNFIFNNEDFKFTKDTVIIGHSSGAVAILGLLQHLPENSSVESCVLVGSFMDDLGWDSLKDLFVEPFKFERIKKKSKRFIFVHSDNDPYYPLEHAGYLSAALDGDLIVVNGQGHFNLEKGPEYKKFPLLLDLLGIEDSIKVDVKSAAIILIKENTALLQLRDNKPNISYPAHCGLAGGGHVEEGETPTQAAKRELREETDYVSKNPIPLMTAIYTLPDGRTVKSKRFYEIYDGKQVLTCHEGQKIEFLSLEDMEKVRMFPGFTDAVKLAFIKANINL